MGSHAVDHVQASNANLDSTVSVHPHSAGECNILWARLQGLMHQREASMAERSAVLAAREQHVQQQAAKHQQVEQLLVALWQHVQKVTGQKGPPQQLADCQHQQHQQQEQSAALQLVQELLLQASATLDASATNAHIFLEQPGGSTARLIAARAHGHGDPQAGAPVVDCSAETSLDATHLGPNGNQVTGSHLLGGVQQQLQQQLAGTADAALGCNKFQCPEQALSEVRDLTQALQLQHQQLKDLQQDMASDLQQAQQFAEFLKADQEAQARFQAWKQQQQQQQQQQQALGLTDRRQALPQQQQHHMNGSSRHMGSSSNAANGNFAVPGTVDSASPRFMHHQQLLQSDAHGCHVQQQQQRSLSPPVLNRKPWQGLPQLKMPQQQQQQPPRQPSPAATLSSPVARTGSGGSRVAMAARLLGSRRSRGSSVSQGSEGHTRRTASPGLAQQQHMQQHEALQTAGQQQLHLDGNPLKQQQQEQQHVEACPIVTAAAAGGISRNVTRGYDQMQDGEPSSPSGRVCKKARTEQQQQQQASLTDNLCQQPQQHEHWPLPPAPELQQQQVFQQQHQDLGWQAAAADAIAAAPDGTAMYAAAATAAEVATADPLSASAASPEDSLHDASGLAAAAAAAGGAAGGGGGGSKQHLFRPTLNRNKRLVMLKGPPDVNGEVPLLDVEAAAAVLGERGALPAARNLNKGLRGQARFSKQQSLQAQQWRPQQNDQQPPLQQQQHVQPEQQQLLQEQEQQEQQQDGELDPDLDDLYTQEGNEQHIDQELEPDEQQHQHQRPDDCNDMQQQQQIHDHMHYEQDSYSRHNLLLQQQQQLQQPRPPQLQPAPWCRPPQQAQIHEGMHPPPSFGPGPSHSWYGAPAEPQVPNEAYHPNIHDNEMAAERGDGHRYHFQGQLMQQHYQQHQHLLQHQPQQQPLSKKSAKRLRAALAKAGQPPALIGAIAAGAPIPWDAIQQQQQQLRPGWQQGGPGPGKARGPPHFQQQQQQQARSKHGGPPPARQQPPQQQQQGQQGHKRKQQHQHPPPHHHHHNHQMQQPAKASHGRLKSCAGGGRNVEQDASEQELQRMVAELKQQAAAVVATPAAT